MIEVHPNLFVGDETSLDLLPDPLEGWSVVHAAKDPWHRKLLGYQTKGAPADHPERLIARRGNELYLNLVDANQVEYIPVLVIDAALEFMRDALSRGDKLFVHCNMGMSRSPTIALLYMARGGAFGANATPQYARSMFWDRYPKYEPGLGMWDFVVANWDWIVKGVA